MKFAEFRHMWRDTSDRKRRLFACACCRRLWDLLDKAASRNAVVVAERFVEGEASEYERARAAYRAEADVIIGRDEIDTMYELQDKVRRAGWEIDEPPISEREIRAHRELRRRQDAAAYIAEWAVSDPVDDPSLLRNRAMIPWDLVAEVFGDFSRSVAFAPAWCTETAVALARSMYDSRDFGAMPVLADALEEAGCDAADVLAHCRGAGPHVRGCWVVDRVLGLG